MPITPTNAQKHTITPASGRKGGYAFWGDPIVTWGDASYGWGSPYAALTNQAKHTITPTNKPKS